MGKIADFIEKQNRKKNIKLLCSIDPERLVKFGENSVISAFKRAATRVPAYQKILKERNIDHREIRNLDAFRKRVPVISKAETSPKYEIEEFCIDGTLDEAKGIMTSSGYSGVYSYGISSRSNQKKLSRSTGAILDYIFDTSNKEMLFISSGYFWSL